MRFRAGRGLRPRHGRGDPVLHHRMQSDGWLSIDNPFAEDDPIVLVPPLRPDVTILHAPLADRFGNVWIGRRSEFATMARASAKTLVTFEERFAGDLMADPDKAPATIPAFHVTALSHQPNGAWPLHGGMRTRRTPHICASTPSARRPPTDSPNIWMPTFSTWT